MAVDDRVTAHIQLELAKAKDRLAHLEAREKEVPVLSGTSNARLLLSRRVNNARNLASGWARVAALLEVDQRETSHLVASKAPKVTWCNECSHPTHPGNACTMAVNVDTDHEQECGCETPAPERTVGWARYIENARDQVVCNRARCKNAYPESATTEWIPVLASAAYLRPCDQCGTDMLAGAVSSETAPERTVAWEANTGILVCATSRNCRQFYGPHLDWFSRTASDLGESGVERYERICARCGTDVLA